MLLGNIILAWTETQWQVERSSFLSSTERLGKGCNLALFWWNQFQHSPFFIYTMRNNFYANNNVGVLGKTWDITNIIHIHRTNLEKAHQGCWPYGRCCSFIAFFLLGWLYHKNETSSEHFSHEAENLAKDTNIFPKKDHTSASWQSHGATGILEWDVRVKPNTITKV